MQWYARVAFMLTRPENRASIGRLLARGHYCYIINLEPTGEQRHHVFFNSEEDAKMVEGQDGWTRVDQDDGYEGPAGFPAFLIAEEAKARKYDVLRSLFPGLEDFSE